MHQDRSTVYLFDVDNTLLDNDRAQRDYRAYIERECGREAADHYWAIFTELWRELGYADYLGALQRYRLVHRRDPRLLLVSSYLLDYPFADRLYPDALRVLDHFDKLGQTVILSDGDVIFQPRKIERSGIRRAVKDRVLICIHKELELDDVERLYPAQHYVLFDDKVRILRAVKEVWGSRVTTVFVKQGSYAHDVTISQDVDVADVTVDVVASLLRVDPHTFRTAGAARGARRNP